MISLKNFKCKRCADCCKYFTVKLYKRDVRAIKREGYKEDFFVGYDNYIKCPTLRSKNGKCVFLGKKNDKYYCKIYRIRPKICRSYPFINKTGIESCKPILLKHSSLK